MNKFSCSKRGFYFSFKYYICRFYSKTIVFIPKILFLHFWQRSFRKPSFDFLKRYQTDQFCSWSNRPVSFLIKQTSFVFDQTDQFRSWSNRPVSFLIKQTSFVLDQTNQFRSVTPIEKLSRRHLINYSDVWLI